MNIVVCVKQVPDTSIPIEVDLRTKSIRTDDLVYVVNPYDKLAVEEAVRIKERSEAAHLTLVSVGGSSARRLLRSCLAMGADRAVLVCDPALLGSDGHAIAAVLARAIKSLEYDLVLCGAKSADTNAGFVGPAIAEILGIPCVSEVTRIEAIDNHKMTVHKKLDRGDRAIVETSVPALLTIEAGINEPRYASLPSLMLAQRRDIEQYDLNALGISIEDVVSSGWKTKVVGFSPPTPGPKRLFTPDSSLSAAERRRLVMSGGITEKTGQLLDGDPEEIALRLIEYFRQEKLIRF